MTTAETVRILLFITTMATVYSYALKTLYREGKTSLYVNRGIGMESGNAPRVRFWARPELTVIDVVPPVDQQVRP